MARLFTAIRAGDFIFISGLLPKDEDGRFVRGATAGVPTKRQAFVELLFGFVDDQVKGIFHGKRHFVTPLALTVFVWVLLMNGIKVASSASTVSATFTARPLA